ncbi:MAG: hypothetical protein GXO74_13165 [Calditrichaeota bacterium]|nr:hypothetical protein [Calditrichota bacterium]
MTTVKKQFLILSVIWLLLFLLSQYLLGFQHWDVPSLSIANYYLFLMIFLLAVTIAVKEKYFPIAYLYVSLMALAYLSGFFVMFTGKAYGIGDDSLMYKCWGYRKIAIHLAVFLSVAYIAICQVGRNCKRVFRVAVSLALGFLVAYFFFRDLVYNPGQLLQEGIIDRLLSAGIAMNALTIVLISVYSLSYYRQGKPFSGHINFLVVGFFFFLLIDINDNYFTLQQKESPIISQVILIINLIYFVLVLAHKLYFMQSPYGSFWEEAVSGKRKTKYDIILKISSVEKKLLEFTERFQPAHRWILSVILICIAIVLLILFFPYEYTARTVAVIIVFAVLLLSYLFYLIKKKTNKEFKIKRKEKLITKGTKNKQKKGAQNGRKSEK